MTKPDPNDAISSSSEPEADEDLRAPESAPSSNPATNLLISDIVVRGASSLLHKRIEKKVADEKHGDPDMPESPIDGRTVLTTLGLYGASKLATRSPIGLGIVAGGLVLKSLYDRGKTRQRRRQQSTKSD